MLEHNPRIVGALVGDIYHEPGARTKYGLLFAALSRRFPLVNVYDATLRGFDRWLNALLVAHPNRRRWKERFYQNVPAFRARSQQAARYLHSLSGQADVVLQVGVLFDARWDEALSMPNIIYTDYTARLAAQRQIAGRSPFLPRQREQWIELERQAFQRATHIFTRGGFVRESILADYGIPPNQVTAIGGGVNFDPLPEPVNQSSGPPTALFIGKEFYRKGGDVLLRAFAQTRAEVPNARLLLVTGDAIPANLPLDGVEVISPTWERAAIAQLFHQSPSFVLPSRLETWGDVLLEAMAYGLPCIGVTGEAMAEIIDHEATGLIVPPENVDALALALIRILSNSGLRQQWGNAARWKLETTYTWDHVVQQMASIIETTPPLSVV